MTSHKISSLNGKYSMFARIADDAEVGGPKFLFSAEDDLTSKGLETTCGSRILKGHVPIFNAAAIEKMEAAGGKLAGKTNMDEFGAGSFCTTSQFGIPKNPFDTERSCGGAAGGSACAAAVMEGHVSLAASTNGSICCPASFCGVFGLAPTYGRISKFGLIDCSNSIDKVGLISSDPGKLAEFLPILSGKDSRDPVSCAQPPLELKGRRIKTIAVPEDSLSDVSKEVLSCFDSSLETLKGMGIEIEKVKMPSLKYALPACTAISAAEASTNLASYVGMRYGQQDGDLSLKFDDYFTSVRTEYFGEEVKKRILLGTFARTGEARNRYYMKSLRARSLVISCYKKTFGRYDAVLTPTMPFTAPRFDDISKMTPAESDLAGFLTAPPDLAGMPHMSVPCGYSNEGMPIGMQIVTAHWNEDPLLTFAKDWTSAFAVKKPGVTL